MNFPSILVSLPLGALIVLGWVFLHRQLVSGGTVTSLTLLTRLSNAALYMFFGAIATSLLSVLLSSPAAFADGMFRMLTGAPLLWTLTSAHLTLAFVVVTFIAAALGFQLIHGRAARSRPFRRFLRGLPPSSGRSQPDELNRYPPAPPPAGPTDL